MDILDELHKLDIIGVEMVQADVPHICLPRHQIASLIKVACMAQNIIDVIARDVLDDIQIEALDDALYELKK